MSLAAGRLTHFWAWFPVIASLLSLARLSFAQRNVSIPLSVTQVDYTPFLCTNPSADVAKQCEGAWELLNSNGTPFVSTNGPVPGSLIPQMFLQFRASAFYLSTSALSNATANLTVSNNGTVLEANFNSSVGMVSVLNLLESELSTVAITFIVDALPARLDITNITLTVTGEPATSVFLPSMTAPASATLPIFGSATVSSSATPVGASAGNRTLVAEAVGITLGLSLGLTAIAVFGYLCWRRRRRRRPPADNDSEASRSMRSAWPPASRSQTVVVGSGWATRAFVGQDASQDQREKRWWS